MDNQQSLILIIAGFGALTMLGVFWRMGSGFGPYNLRIVGIVLVATLAALLGLNQNSVTAAMGILGGIAGYLFGLRDRGPTG
jgi:hypothetical protein